jgi:3-phosphoshikimate 1-carboxyvinyltransferase
MGAQVIELNDGLEIHGRGTLRGARVASFGDHRIAMAFAVAGLFAEGETVVQDAQCVHESYPEFEKALEEFINPRRIRITTPVISSLTPSRVDEE